MGWTFIQADLNKTRKQLAIKEVEWEYCEKSCKVIYAREVASIVYMAVKASDAKTGDSHVFGVVALTKIQSNETFNFGIKLMDETMLPNYYGAPKKLLNLLSPTDDEWALMWRKECMEQHERNTNYNRVQRQMRTLPFGTVLRLHNKAKTLVELWPCRTRVVYKIVGQNKRVSLGLVADLGFDIISIGRKKVLPE